MAQVSVPEKQKMIIVWNFMEELLENYQNAIENSITKVFHFKDFFSFGLLSDGFTEDDKIAIIKEYAKEKGYIKIKGDTVTLTNKGKHEARKSKHDWDTLHHN
jgi:predicted methyltransferase